MSGNKHIYEIIVFIAPPTRAGDIRVNNHLNFNLKGGRGVTINYFLNLLVFHQLREEKRTPLLDISL